MTDRKALADPNETPEDVATLYSWANLHGAKYRDFSASRAQSREKARQRVQQAIEKERERAEHEAGEQRAAEAMRAQEAVRQAELAAAQQVAREAAQQAAQAALPPWQPQAAPQPAPQPASDRFYAQPEPSSAPSQAAYPPQSYPSPSYDAAPAYRPSLNPPQFAPMREESQPQPRLSWPPAEPPIRPAWLATEHLAAPSQPAPAPAHEDTLQGSRERLASRWFALKGLFEGAPAPDVAAPAPQASRAPVLAVFSLAGGVGKTSLVATLGRALSARGERVLLVDTAAYGLLPFFFGAHDQRPGVLRTFNPPADSGDAPVQMITVDPEGMGPETAGPEPLSSEIGKHAHGMSRVIVDLATASGATTRRILRLSPIVLVPLIPDMNSVVSVSSIDAFFQHNSAAGKPVRPYYVLNQFDSSLPLHLDVREVLREQLGDRLLPFALRRAPAVSEALAEGMTVMDYAPNSTVAEDFGSLAGWVKSLSAPASSGFRGVRWSER